MEKMKRLGEWKEAIPNGNLRANKHQFSGIVTNIVEEFGAKSVIDFGCGEGLLSQSFSPSCYLGLDIDEKVLNLAKSYFSDYYFSIPSEDIYSTDMCIAASVFNYLKEEQIHNILKKMRCKWFLIAEPLFNGDQDGNIYSFHTRNREDYIKLMRNHDLLLVKHIIKSIEEKTPSDVSFLVFRKSGRNPAF